MRAGFRAGNLAARSNAAPSHLENQRAASTVLAPANSLHQFPPVADRSGPKLSPHFFVVASIYMQLPDRISDFSGSNLIERIESAF